MRTTLWLFAGFFFAWLGAGCPIGVNVCQDGQDCEARQRCVTNLCQTPPDVDNRPPIARAGSDQRVPKGVRVRLDAGRSADVDLDRVTFSWSFFSRPLGSRAVFDNKRSPQASFVPDLPGEYVAKVTVVDALGLKDEDLVNIRVNHPPEASAGGEQLVLPNATVTLRGDRSRDLDKDPLSYRWVLVERPAGSQSQLTSNNTAVTSFLADKPGVFVAELRVSDGLNQTRQRVVVRVTNPENITPSLQNLTPWKASTQSIAVIELVGDGFFQGAEVLFDGLPAKTKTLSRERMQARLDLRTTPPGAYQISVRNPGGRTSEEQLFQVTVVAAPLVKQVSPDVATVGSELTAKVLGEGFVSTAKVLFQGKAWPTVVLDQSQLTVTIPTTGMKAGVSDLVVENSEKLRSTPYPIRLVVEPPTPSIQLVRLEPRVFEINRVYTKLTITARGVNAETQVWVNNKRYRGQILRTPGSTIGILTLPNFSTLGMRPGRVSFQLKNISPGKTLTSTPFHLNFNDPNQVSLYSSRFVLKGRPTLAATETRYEYVELRGRYFRAGLRVFVDGKRWEGKVRLISSGLLRLEAFSTVGLTVGNHTFRVEQTVSAKVFKSPSLNVRLVDGHVPLLRTVTTSDGPLVTERTFTFVRLQGMFFAKNAEVLVDGTLFQGKSYLEGDSTLYLYGLSTKGWKTGSHTFLVRQTIGGRRYSSALFPITVRDGRTPSLVRIRIRPTSLMVVGNRYDLQLTGINLLPDATLLINGVVFKERVLVTGQEINVAGFETLGRTPGTLVFQVRNLVNGIAYTSNGLSATLRAGSPPRLARVTPGFVSVSQNAAPILLQGTSFSSTSALLLNGNKHPASFSGTQAQFTINAKQRGVGKLEIKVRNRDGQQSNSLTLEVVSKLPPLLWEVFPSDLYLPLSSNTSKSFTWKLGGAHLQSSDRLLVDGKAVGTLGSIVGHSARVQLPLGVLQRAGVLTLQVERSDGTRSNKTEVWVQQERTPQIARVSPSTLRVSAAAFPLVVQGRGFSAKSRIVLNGKALPTTHVPSSSSSALAIRITGSLTALVQPSDVVSAPSVSTLQVQREDGASSPSFSLLKSTGATLRLTSAPTSLIAGKSDRATWVFRGVGFTPTSKVSLEGVTLQTTFLGSSQLRVSAVPPKSLRIGQLARFQVRDGALLSNTLAALVERGPRILDILTPTLKKSAPAPTLVIRVTHVNPGTSLRVFNTSYPITNSGTVQWLVSKEIALAKEGLNTLFVTDPQGRKSQTGAIAVLP